MKKYLAMTLAVLVVGCGGDGGPPEPLVTANVTGSADGTNFTPTFGVSTILESGTVTTIIGTGELNCGSITSPTPPPDGFYVNIQIPEATVGIASNWFFSFLIIEGGDVSSGGSNQGSVEVTAVSSATIAMTVAYSDTVNGVDYAVNGDFEAVRCP